MILMENLIKTGLTRHESELYVTLCINKAKERVYVSISDEGLPYIINELEAASRRGLKVTAIIPGEAQISGVVIYRYVVQNSQVRLIADSSDVLTGSLPGREEDTCLFSRNQPLVALIKDSLRNEIRLSELEGFNR